MQLQSKFTAIAAIFVARRANNGAASLSGEAGDVHHQDYLKPFIHCAAPSMDRTPGRCDELFGQSMARKWRGILFSFLTGA